MHAILVLIDHFRYIKIQSQKIDLSTKLWGINTEFVGFIPQSLVLRSYCLRLNFNIIYRIWSISGNFNDEWSNIYTDNFRKRGQPSACWDVYSDFWACLTRNFRLFDFPHRIARLSVAWSAVGNSTFPESSGNFSREYLFHISPLRNSILFLFHFIEKASL